MQVKFLGTAAAEGWPGLFCECEFCEKARFLGGRNIRTRSSIMIGDRHKVDLPPDTYLHVLRHNLNLAKVEHLFVTHAHYDHFHPDDLCMRKKPFAHMKEPKLLHVYGNQQVISLTTSLSQDTSKLRLSLHLVEPFKTLDAGEFKVTPLLADHAADQVCLLYLFENNGKTFLHRYDSGWFQTETWQALENHKLDLAVLDCTMGKFSQSRYHLGIREMVKMKNHMLSMCIADKNTIFVATHFSHNGGLLHEELTSRLKPENIQVAFDGLTLNL